MDRYFPTSSPEYQAHTHIAAYVFWDANIGPKDIGLCAAYAALSRFVKGEDLYLPPRDQWELQAILRMYSDHVINSLCSQVVSRVAIRNSNGHAVARAQTEASLKRILSLDNNMDRLVALHSAPAVEPVADLVPETASTLDAASAAFDGVATPRRIRTK